MEIPFPVSSSWMKFPSISETRCKRSCIQTEHAGRLKSLEKMLADLEKMHFA
jgi:hypothetical protein